MLKRLVLVSLGVGTVALGLGFYLFSQSNDGLRIHAESGVSSRQDETTETADSLKNESAAPVVLVEKAVLKQQAIHRKYFGSFEPIQNVVVVSRVAGDILEQRFEEGSLVQKGDVLFEIEKIRYEAALEAAQAQVAVCEAKLETIAANLRQSEARLTYAKNNYERNKTLFEQGGNIITQDTLENVKSVFDAQAAEVASIKASGNVANAELEAAKASLKLAQDDMKHTTIRAMISGRVGRINHTVGNFVTPETGSLVEIVQTDPIYLRFSTSEPDFTSLFGNVENLKKGSKIRIELADGRVYPEPGEIAFIDNRMDEGTNSVNIWATFKNGDELLNPGGVATVYLDKIEDKYYPAVKETGVMFDGKRHAIYVVGENNQIERREVEIGSGDGEYQNIVSGLSEGEIVVVDGTHKIRIVPGADGKPLPVFVQPTYTPTVYEPEKSSDDASRSSKPVENVVEPQNDVLKSSESKSNEQGADQR